MTAAVAVLTAAAGVPLLTASPAAAADPVTFLPNGGTVQQYTVPAGVTSLGILAVGGTGGRGGAVNDEQSRAPGGRGGTVETTIPVTEGEIIEVVVGANGEGAGEVAGALGGNPRGGQGGGKSSVLTCRRSSPCPDNGTVVLYAGGGGGGGGRGASGPGTNGGTGASVGSAKGGNGTTGVVYVAPAIGGASGTTTESGAGGARGTVEDCTGTHGFAGASGAADNEGNTTPGKGGNGAADGGGGGGGGGDGFRPGGGGGGGAGCAASDEADGGGAGGGAGSSYLAGAEGTFGTDATATPRVVLTPNGASTELTPPTMAKTFTPSSIPVGGTTTLGITLTNPNPSAALTGVGFTDDLPAGLAVANPNNATTTCTSGTILAIVGSTSVRGADLALAAGASCTISVDLKATTTGVKVNTATPTATETGAGNPASATLTVLDCSLTITGDTGPVTVVPGQCATILNARVSGPVIVGNGAGLMIASSSISGGVVANGPSVVTICGSQLMGSPALAISDATQPIRIGGAASGCTRNRIYGAVTLGGNQGVTFADNQVVGATTIDGNGPSLPVIRSNTIVGSLSCSGNDPAPTNQGGLNAASSKLGQCAAL